MNSQQVRSIEQLIAAVEHGHRPKYLFFWGHRPLPGGEIGKSVFSQWYEAPFVVEGTRYTTAEHFMMAGKARLFGDAQAHERIVAAASPNEAKKLGRTVQGFDDVQWKAARFDLVVAGNLAKFSQNAAMGEFLKSTGDRVIVEASPVDKVWGIGTAADEPHAENPLLWKGLNLLGFALMEVRERLIEQEQQKRQ
ncbi:NADAR family protein [Piscinibacter terrae]|uniref:NADAR family protein n=1 Tax=Piscinibacter terrae TaxID=2496871 RepID=A0A3N7HLN0_9BURK|nr:NADAR family protein [Albitalea terrae]RQP22483.1 NADAR family protein [Albitalea terrae]